MRYLGVMCLCLIIILKGHCIIIISSHGFGVHSSIHPKQEEDLPFSDHALQQVTIEKSTMALFWSLLLNYILLIRKKLFPLLTNILQWHTEYFCMLFKTENGVSSSNNCMYIIYYKKIINKKKVQY